MATTSTAAEALAVEGLRTEYLVTPLAVTVERPRFSWTVRAAARRARVVAYQVVVASRADAFDGAAPREDAVVWDSGRVASDACAHVACEARLEHATRYWWTVRVWDGDEEPSDWCASWFETELAPGGFEADWIGLSASPFERDDFRPPALLRRELTVRERPRAARLYATALGVYELHVNGSRVGDARLRPGWTDYSKRVQYQVHDVTDLIADGPNALGILLGEGWYAGRVGMSARRGLWGDRPAVAAQLVLDYADGSREVVVTDDSWRGATGPILRSDLLLGELYDARQERPGWAAAGYDASAWEPVTVLPGPQVDLVPERAEPVRATQELAPVAISSPVFSTHVFDLGQNISGWTRLRVQAPRGTEIAIRHGEALLPDGTLYTANLRLAAQTERYICKGEGVETFEPSFTYHGFRYVEVTNLPGEPTADTITGVVAHTDVRPVGELHCSDELVNKLHESIAWTVRANTFEVPTDNPQRDERAGWLGDARIFAPTACFSYDLAAFYGKYLDDVLLGRTDDGYYPNVAPWAEIMDGAPGWADGGVFLPWILYEQYGDERILARHLDAMATYVDLVHTANPSLIRRERLSGNWSDWLSVPEADPAIGRGAGGVESAYSTTPPDVFATALFKRIAELVARAAGVLGRDADARRFTELAEAVRQAFCDEFVAGDGTIAGDTQTAYLLALAFDLLPDELRAAAGDRLLAAIERHGGHLSTGTTGAELLLPVLQSIGRTDVAVRLLLETEHPSWGHMIESGATTIWEQWSGRTEAHGFADPRINSMNQPALGSVGAWIYASIGGIELLEPGYRRVRVRPLVDTPIRSATAAHHSIRGTIRTSWELRGDALELAVEIPVGCTALVHVPCAQGGLVSESGVPAATAEGVRAVGSEEGRTIFEIESGRYVFTSMLEKG